MQNQSKRESTFDTQLKTALLQKKRIYSMVVLVLVVIAVLINHTVKGQWIALFVSLFCFCSVVFRFIVCSDASTVYL